MARYTGPKRRLSRREGVALFAKDVAYIERKGATPPGQRGVRMRRKISEFSIQLREKQKTKRIYGVLEKQFTRYYESASKRRGNRGLGLMELLETRLDNVVYRLGFASSRAAARQLVSHRHIMVDSQRVTVPSFQIKPGQTIAISQKMLDNTQIQKSLATQQTLPEWLERQATVGKVLRLPKRDEMEQGINESLIIEYYSR